MNPKNRKALLFSYGTLQYRNIQLEHFGRELTGRADILPGYTLGKMPINDPEVIASSGETHYRNVVPSANPVHEVLGMVFEMTEAELLAADRYEEDAGYFRIQVILKSGAQAWVYLVGR